MESEEEEGIGKARDTVEEVDEIYHDAVEEEGNTEEDSKEEEKEENAESKREVTKYAGVTQRRRTSSRARFTDDVRSQAGTSLDRTGCTTGQTVNSSGEQGRQYDNMLISTCI